MSSYVKKRGQMIAYWTVHADLTERAQFCIIYNLVHIMLWTSHREQCFSNAYVPWFWVLGLELVFSKLIFLSGYYSTI